MEINKDIFYNIATQDISNGLKDLEISSSQDYFILLEAPTNANIRVKLNSVTAHEIPIKENWQFNSDRVGKIYLSCDAIEGKKIKYGQADGNLNISPNPTINSIDTITNIENFNDNLLSQLDKIINPYSLGLFTSLNAPTGSNGTVLISKELQCDKIKVWLSFPNAGTSFDTCYLTLDGVYICNANTILNSSYGVHKTDTFIEMENIRGKNLQIIGRSSCGATLQEYILKA